MTFFSYQIGTEEDKTHFYGGTYRALLSLLRHEHEDTPVGLFWMVLCSVLHLRTLQMAGYFGPNVKYDQPLTEEQCLVGAFLVDILQLLRYNTHSVLEYVVSKEKLYCFVKLEIDVSNHTTLENHFSNKSSTSFSNVIKYH